MWHIFEARIRNLTNLSPERLKEGYVAPTPDKIEYAISWLQTAKEEIDRQQLSWHYRISKPN